jgi:hypothetical protein
MGLYLGISYPNIEGPSYCRVLVTVHYRISRCLDAEGKGRNQTGLVGHELACVPSISGGIERRGATIGVRVLGPCPRSGIQGRVFQRSGSWIFRHAPTIAFVMLFAALGRSGSVLDDRGLASIDTHPLLLPVFFCSFHWEQRFPPHLQATSMVLYRV